MFRRALCIGICIENVQSTISDQALIFTWQKLISLKIVVYTFTVMKGVFQEDLEPMLSSDWLRLPGWRLAMGLFALVFRVGN